MADTFQLEIATPERSIVNQPVRSALLPGEEGFFEVLRDHGALLSILDPGVLTYEDDAGTHILAIDGGFAEVLDNCVRVLTTHARQPEEIDLDRARRQMEKDLKTMRQAQQQHDAENAMHAYKTTRALVDAAEQAANDRPLAPGASH